MTKYLLSIAVISLLWHMSLSTHECNRTLNAGILTFLCPSNISSQLLNLYDLNVAQLDSVTSIMAKGRGNTTVGPFTAIPPNICLLRNLQSIDFSSNQISDPEPTGALIKCSTKLITLNLGSNYISQFPSALIYNLPSVTYFYFPRNQLKDVSPYSFANLTTINTIDFSYNQFTTFELWPVKVQNIADFSYNQISMITNNYFYTAFSDAINSPTVYLTNNSATINFTDAIYTIFDECQEAYEWAISNNPDPMNPIFTQSLIHIEFGTTKINCSCDQYYYLKTLINSFSRVQDIFAGGYPITRATCSNGDLFLNSTCIQGLFTQNSTVDFTRVYPKLCQIYPNSTDINTPIVNYSAPTLNLSNYIHYETAFLNPGACFFTFYNVTTVNLICTIDTSNTNSTLPSSLLSNPYMLNITRVYLNSSISSLPSFLCSLPSQQIDLSFQTFTTLTSTTFTCLDSFTKITLSNNQLTSVNTVSQNFTTLSYLDLSSNGLTSIPYSILHPTPTSLRVLDLRNNSIKSIDIFLYTLKNITVLLDNNPINASNVINSQNITLDTNSTRGNDTVIIFPASVTNSTYIVNDANVASVLKCIDILSVKNLFINYEATYKAVFLDCSCQSYSLRGYFMNNSDNILNYLNCSSSTNATTYQALTLANCPNPYLFQLAPCNQTTTTTAAPPPVAVQATASNTGADHTGLIVGIVVGIIGGLLVIAAILIAIYLLKFKSAAPAKAKTEKRVDTTSDEVISKRVQPRNLRSVRLAPITTPSSELPKIPVSTAFPKSNSTLLANPNTNSRTAAKGIPVRFDSIKSPTDVTVQYPPNSNALSNSSSFRPINNSTTNQPAVSQESVKVPKPQKPQANSILNIGGDKRY